MRDGVASVLDYLRRRGALLDPEFKVFTKFWMDGSTEVQQGYLPSFIKPIGLKLRRRPDENSQWVVQWLSSAGDCAAISGWLSRAPRTATERVSRWCRWRPPREGSATRTSC